MILITQASTNYAYVTTREKELLTNPSYLMKFKCASTKDIRYCYVTDSSSYPERYQKFTIVETTTPTATTNQIKLDTKGIWDYYIYEYTGSAPADETGLTEVEQGQAEVVHTATSYTSYDGYQSTYKKY